MGKNVAQKADEQDTGEKWGQAGWGVHGVKSQVPELVNSVTLLCSRDKNAVPIGSVWVKWVNMPRDADSKLFFFWLYWVWTEGLTLAGQVLSYLSHSTSQGSC
jgi:hypothetical protein